jgi:hypothetical protein
VRLSISQVHSTGYFSDTELKLFICTCAISTRPYDIVSRLGSVLKKISATKKKFLFDAAQKATPLLGPIRYFKLSASLD